MGKKIFVGNLSFNTTNADLETLFSEVGHCESAAVITDRETGRSRGFGFVEMSSPAEAQKEITTLNGPELPGPDGPNVGVTLRERRRHVVMEVPGALLAQAADDLSAREMLRVRIKTRRDRMLFQAPPRPLPKNIASTVMPGGFGAHRVGGGPRGWR